MNEPYFFLKIKYAIPERAQHNSDLYDILVRLDEAQTKVASALFSDQLERHEASIMYSKIQENINHLISKIK